MSRSSPDIAALSVLLLHYTADDANKDAILTVIKRALKDYDADREGVVAPLGRPIAVATENASVTPEEDGTVMAVPTEDNWIATLRKVTRNVFDGARETYSSVADQVASNTAAFFKATLDLDAADNFDPKRFMLSLMTRPGSWDVGARPSLKVRIMDGLLRAYALASADDAVDCFPVRVGEGNVGLQFDDEADEATVPELDRIKGGLHAGLHHARIHPLMIPGQAMNLCENMIVVDTALRMTRLMRRSLLVHHDIGTETDPLVATAAQYGEQLPVRHVVDGDMQTDPLVLRPDPVVVVDADAQTDPVVFRQPGGGRR